MATDSEGDFSDELLELAGASEKKRKRRQTKSSGSKRRKPECVALSSSLLQNVTEHLLSVKLDTSEDEPESEEEIEDFNPYPFDGKYVDEADRQKCVVAFALISLSELTTPPIQFIKHARN